MVSLPAGMRLNASPNSCPGCYTLDCYCKYDADHHPWSQMAPSFQEGFYEPDEAACKRVARKAGWILHLDGTATCPRCAKALAGHRDARVQSMLDASR